jgi:transposase
MWAVGDVTRDAQASLDGRLVQHLVSLVSVEDDATGEELAVVWEIEPGTRVVERAELPLIAAGRLDDPSELDAFLDAIRWGAVTSADQRALQAPFRSGITIEDFQLEPLVRALRMPRTALLIADDVGLGKTIEAGLIVQELLLRHRAPTALVVCPAALQLQWRDEMREKFGLEFRIVDRELLGQLRRSRGVGANPFAHFPRLIVSIDWLKGDLGMRLLRQTLPPHPQIPRRYDVLIVDEVHNCAPAGAGGRYARDTLRTAAIRTLAPHCEHRLFLSATPHNGYDNDVGADRLYGHIKKRKGRVEFLEFCRYIRSLYPPEIRLHFVLDNFSPHLGEQVCAWATANNVELAYTPFYASWLNRIEAQFRALRYFTLAGTDHPDHATQARLIRRYIAWRNRNTDNPRLRALINTANVA